jgi:catechol 2,3-dioxygenase
MESISPRTRIGDVRLRVANLAESVNFYTDIIGLECLTTSDGLARLGAGGKELLILQASRSARPIGGTTGLYHFALLLPLRRNLASTTDRILRSGYPLEGTADHLVSEAVYLRDPEGNGIEIYRDRPRAQWLDGRGKIRMDTLPLDLPGLLKESSRSSNEASVVPQETRVGHIHLHVSRLAEAVSFYCGVLGFELMARYGSSAAFVSAGGYHHHIGLNTWAGEGAPALPADATGLIRYRIVLPEQDVLASLVGRLARSSIPFQETEEAVLLTDPSQNGIVLSLASSES